MNAMISYETKAAKLGFHTNIVQGSVGRDAVRAFLGAFLWKVLRHSIDSSMESLT